MILTVVMDESTISTKIPVVIRLEILAAKKIQFKFCFFASSDSSLLLLFVAEVRISTRSFVKCTWNEDMYSLFLSAMLKETRPIC